MSMLPASMELSPPEPAPTMVCSSSMNRMMRPSESFTSRSTAFKRSSNSPRYFAPASMEAMSSVMMSRSFRLDGTSPLTMRCARPSTMAVLPVPGSPMSTGLFFVRRESTWMVRRISSVRPMTGSSLPSRACWVRFWPYWFRASSSILDVWSVTRASPRSWSYASSTVLAVLGQRDEQVLGGHVAIAHLVGDLLCSVDDLDQVVARDGHHGHAPPLAWLRDGRVDVRFKLRRVGADALEDGLEVVLGRVEQRLQQVDRLDDARLRIGRHAHRSLEGLGCRGAQFV